MTSPLTLATSHSPRLSGLSQIIGNTPLLEVSFRFRAKQRVIYAKSEQLNLTGSIKDRMALHILREAYRSGQIHPGDTIAEATSGNTGISFAAIGRALSHPVKIFMPNWMSLERQSLIRSYDAEIVLVSAEQGGFLGSIHMSEEFAASRADVFLPRQFSNTANSEAHETTTGPEIWAQLESAARLARGAARTGKQPVPPRCARYGDSANPETRKREHDGDLLHQDCSR
jgi:cysteine synthase A